MAALFGNGLVMDAFSVAFRVPNLARHLFGEGALTAAFLPIFVREIEREGRTSAWKLASAVLSILAFGLSVLVVVVEIWLWWLPHLVDMGAEGRLLTGLTAVLLPYLLLICLAAQISAMLHALGHFTWPALLPVLLNVVWIVGIWVVAPLFVSSEAQAYAIAASILVGGTIQMFAGLPKLRSLGFRFDRAWRAALPRVAEVARTMLPVVIGLSVTQINVLADSMIAWSFSGPVDGPDTMALPGEPAYPLVSGTASALYFGQRMYQFPLGVFGVALGTVLFPLLSRHAERGRLDLLRRDLSLGMRLVIVVGLPASLGLVLLARPLTVLIFQHGAFDAADAAQTVSMIATYGTAVWAYCGLLIVHRGYYAAGDRQTPLNVGVLSVLLNLALNLSLIWFVGGRGLAMGTAISSTVQLIAVTWFLQHRLGRFDWREFRTTTLKAVVATGVMGLVCYGSVRLLPGDESLIDKLIAVFVPLTTSILVYFALARSLGMNELWLLFKRDSQLEGGTDDVS